MGMGSKKEVVTCFESHANTLGLDFGMQIMLRFYSVHRVSFDDLANHLAELAGSGDNGAGFRAGVAVHNFGGDQFGNVARNASAVDLSDSYVFAYRQTDNALSFQRAWRYMSLFTSTVRSKVLIFYFSDDDAMNHAKNSWPSKLRLGSVESSLIKTFNTYEFSRHQIRKGKLTFYLYAVKKSDTNFEGEKKFRELKSYIENLKPFT